jgi:hypothetical protein
MKTIIISFLELFFIFGGIGVFVLGQSLPTLMKHKQPFKHYFLMVVAIFKIETRKACSRLLMPVLFGFVIFFLLIPIIPPMGDNLALFYTSKPIFILGCINLFFLSFPIIARLMGLIRKKQEKDWMAIRIRAHYSIYGKYPKPGEYGMLIETL